MGHGCGQGWNGACCDGQQCLEAQTPAGAMEPLLRDTFTRSESIFAGSEFKPKGERRLLARCEWGWGGGGVFPLWQALCHVLEGQRKNLFAQPRAQSGLGPL